ncbi:outer membrane beta-barrel family protein [Winogradskyella aquimaris]|uniref:Outer membrane beta-barrel family protein n=1 Tax=Winogradskyella aquimaris TaxID=864074 RepID=A0ABU5EIR6_9FLAO|nr:outer membrane beta-barrel family protein [Winogradskyella aquimaris]MDY2586210.1 outer membrane beta-barrel family protein [Winogradskyella aquimaris]
MITHLRSCLSIIIFALSFNVFAQNFSILGKVVDSENQPIGLANVVLLQGEEKQFLIGTSTDDNGYFNLVNLNEDTYYLRVSFIGLQEFEQKIILTGNLDLKTIRLEETPESLDEVTVVAKKPTITRKPDRLVFNIENTPLIEGTTLAVLKSTPGVIVSEEGINIKSAAATVYINERRVQLSSSELMQLLESAPANSIKSIEVITNPPASYDADSGSVINIVMSNNLVTGYRGSVQTNYTQGVFPRYNAATSHYFKNDKINLNLNYSYTNQKINRDQDNTVNYFDNNGDINEVWKSNVNRNTWSEIHNLNLSFDYFIDERNTLSLTSSGLYTPYFKYRLKNTTNIFDEDNNFLSSFDADNLSLDDKYNIGTDVIFKHEFKNKSSLTFNGHFTIYDYKRDQSVFQDEPLDINDSEFRTIANQDTQIITGKLDYRLPIDETSSFEAGVKYSFVNTESDITRLDIINGIEVINNNNTDAFNYDENVFAAYTNFNKSWDKWDLNIGLRAEQTNIEGRSVSLSEINKQDYLNWFPNVSISHNLHDNMSVYGSYKRSITRASYTDLNPFTFFLNENTIVLGNPNLVPSYRDHYVIGTNFLEHFTVEAYYMNYDGDIVELPRQNNETNIIAYTPTNLDKKTEYGFDFSFDYYPTNTWNLYFVTSFYNITEESNFGEGFVEQSQWSNYSSFNNSLSLLEDRSLNINLAIYWIGKNLQQFQVIEDRLASELSVSKTILKRKGVISLSVSDMFNDQDFFSATRYLNQSSSSFVDVDNRFVKLGFSYKFGNTKLSTNERSTTAEERDRLKDFN